MKQNKKKLLALAVVAGIVFAGHGFNVMAADPVLSGTVTNGGQAIGAGSQASNGGQAIADGSQATTNGALAVGRNAKATGSIATAVGYATASGLYSFAGGLSAEATHNNTTALGRDAKATGAESTAIGNGAKAENSSAVAIGNGADSKGSWGVALGPKSKVNADWSVSLGGNSSVNSSWSTALGYMASVDEKGGRSVALGSLSKVKAGDGDVVSVGNDNLKRKIINVGNGVNANDAVNKSQLDAVEAKINNKVDKGTVGSNGGQAIGAGSKANGAGALALGNASEADGYIATAVGYGHALDTYTVAMGVNAYAYNLNGIAIGTLAKAGATNKDYANADIFNRINPETGKPLYNFSPDYDPRNIRSGAIAIGNLAEAVGYRNTAIGEDAKAGIIIERDDYNHPKKFGLGAVGATAIGAAAIAGGSQATVVGNGAFASEKQTVAVGTRSYTTGKFDTALGSYSVVTKNSAVALGAYARADHANSVALGTNSITEEAKATQSITLNGKEYTFAGGNQSQVVGTVSIGGQGVLGYTDTTDKGHWNDPANATNGNGRTDMNTSIYRTITNVAAGRISADSTDAINGSQLYAVADLAQQNAAGIQDVRNESYTGDAMNAALAALKPIQFDPDEPSQIMAGVGGYKGKHAYALGVAHYFNESVMANIGGSYSSGSSLMWNAGVTFKVGTGSDKTYEPRRGNYKEALAKSQEEIVQLRTELQETKDEVATLKAALADIQKKLK